MVEGLQIRLLGEQELSYRGARLPLPPSKKTRALLGYLALSGHAHRRERLCELLWDVADDPRAALRWSLSKLRELVDHDGTARLLTDRQSVRLELSGVAVDVFELRELERETLSEVSTARLEQVLSSFRGELLEGLELPDFHAYYAFCLAEREGVRRLHTGILCELLSRHVGQPERALPLARKWVDLDPESERARARLLQLLHASGREREATLESSLSERLMASDLRTRTVARDDSIDAQSVGRESQSELGRRELPAPLVGRESELVCLQTLLRTERARVLLLTGDAGIGKSKLLSVLVARVRAGGGLVYEGAAHEVEPGFPYAAFRALFVQLGLGLSERELPGAPLPGVADIARERERLFARVATALEQAVGRSTSPALIVVEDVHWLDEPSALLLHRLVRACCERPLAFVLSARTGELADNAAVRRLVRALRAERMLEELALPALSREETVQLVKPLSGAADAGLVYEQSAGNPLFAIELARAAEPIAQHVPPSIAQLVRERMETLPSELREVLRWASVLGPSFALSTLEPLAALVPQQFVEALEQLERLSWVVYVEYGSQLGEARFAHAVVHRAIYDGLSGPRRRLMHAHVARLFSERESADESSAAELARHAMLAGDAAMAVRACLKAGRRCLRLSATSDAAALARRGLGYVDRLSLPDSCLLEIELHELLLFAQQPRDGEAQALRLSELSARALSLGQLEHARRGFFVQAFLRWEAGQVGDAQRFAAEAERCSRLGGPRERLQGLSDAARCLLLLERGLTDAQAFILEAEALVRSGETELACVAVAHGMLDLHRGALEQAAQALERGSALARVEGDRINEFFALEQRIELELVRERWQSAEPLSAALVTQAEHREGSEGPYARALHALVQLALGRADDAQLEAALKALILVDAKQRTAVVLVRWAELLLARGQAALAAEKATTALSLARAVERGTEMALAQAVLARVALTQGDSAAYEGACSALRALDTSSLSARAQRAIVEVTGKAARVRAPRGASQHGTRDRRARPPGAG